MADKIATLITGDITPHQTSEITTAVSALTAFWQAVDANQEWWASREILPVVNCCILAAHAVRDILHGMGRRDATVFTSGLRVESIAEDTAPVSHTVGCPEAEKLPGCWNAHMTVRFGDLLIDPTIGQARYSWNDLPQSAILRNHICSGKKVPLTERHAAHVTTQHLLEDGKRSVQLSYFKLPFRSEQMARNWRAFPHTHYARRARFVEDALAILRQPQSIAA